MALVLALLLLPLAVGCARKVDGTHRTAAPENSKAIAPTPDRFSEFLAEFLEEGLSREDGVVEPVPNLPDLPPLPQDYLPPPPRPARHAAGGQPADLSQVRPEVD
jgi:hypothetical protein